MGTIIKHPQNKFVGATINIAFFVQTDFFKGRID